MSKKIKVDFTKPQEVQGEVPQENVFVDDSAAELQKLQMEALKRRMKIQNENEFEDMPIQVKDADQHSDAAPAATGRFGALKALLGPSVAQAKEMPTPQAMPTQRTRMPYSTIDQLKALAGMQVNQVSDQDLLKNPIAEGPLAPQGQKASDGTLRLPPEMPDYGPSIAQRVGSMFKPQAEPAPVADEADLKRQALEKLKLGMK